jgi:hypothetical protein
MIPEKNRKPVKTMRKMVDAGSLPVIVGLFALFVYGIIREARPVNR